MPRLVFAIQLILITFDYYLNRVCRKRDIILKCTLHIPSYKQDIISVNSVTKRCVKVVFGPNGAQIITLNDTNFDIMEKGKLSFVNSIGLSVK